MALDPFGKLPWYVQHSRLQHLRKQYATVEKEMDRLCAEHADENQDGSPPGFQVLGDRLSLIDDEIAWILHLRITGSLDFGNFLFRPATRNPKCGVSDHIARSPF
jgi:hypothetical protein